MNVAPAMNAVATETAETLVSVRGLKVHFPIKKGIIFDRTVGHVKAVDGVSFHIQRGESLGMVGESGCGKTTIGRSILRLETPTEGQITYDGQDVSDMSGPDALQYRKLVQAVFQDPYSSLNPRISVGDIISEPLIVHDPGMKFIDRAKRVKELLDLCGLPQNLADRFPHEMSGGQRQRVGIARALALRPEFIVCDEAVSALDVSIQAQIIRLLEDLRQEFGLTYLFIGHDLSVVRHMCQRVAVMYLGKIVEIGDCDSIFSDPKHPYTKALLDAVPVPDPEIEATRSHTFITGEVPSPSAPPPGCVFHPRCAIARKECSIDLPITQSASGNRKVACTYA
ncbi:MAG: ABC transporter ATP-binding protein [Paracoccaceae bacterium]